jgi:hypothetical protein
MPLDSSSEWLTMQNDGRRERCSNRAHVEQSITPHFAGSDRISACKELITSRFPFLGMVSYMHCISDYGLADYGLAATCIPWVVHAIVALFLEPLPLELCRHDPGTEGQAVARCRRIECAPNKLVRDSKGSMSGSQSGLASMPDKLAPPNSTIIQTIAISPHTTYLLWILEKLQLS